MWYSESPHGTHNEGDRSFYESISFLDVLVANQDCIKLKTMYVDLNGWSYPYPYDAARKVAEEILGEDTFLENVYFNAEHLPGRV